MLTKLCATKVAESKAAQCKLKADEAKMLLHDEAVRLRLLKLHSVKLVAEAQAVKIKL